MKALIASLQKISPKDSLIFRDYEGYFLMDSHALNKNSSYILEMSFEQSQKKSPNRRSHHTSRDDESAKDNKPR